MGRPVLELLEGEESAGRRRYQNHHRIRVSEIVTAAERAHACAAGRERDTIKLGEMR